VNVLVLTDHNSKKAEADKLMSEHHLNKLFI